MFRSIRRILICLALLQLAVQATRAQDTPPAQPSAVSPKTPNLNYPDNTRGLERLAKDIISAQREGNQSRALELAESMVLPDPPTWYLRTFGPNIAKDEGVKYATDRKNLPAEILKFFFGAIQNHFTDVTAARFGDSCDDNAGESAFGTLQLRLQPAPFYELRMREGNRFLRLFALVYVDGNFRYALAPRVPEHFPYHERPTATGKTQVTIAGAEGPDQGKKPFRIGANVQAARIVHRVQPEYPEIARKEHLQGTVRLHAIIGKDGSVSNLVVLKGYCSLAKASVKAVSQWRYEPTLLNGEPVEVDTTIDVIFALSL